MAHIPQDARYVDPPTEREVDEDAVTDWAVDALEWHGYCPSCRTGDEVADEAFAAWVKSHATECAGLRAQVLDEMAREAK